MVSNYFEIDPLKNEIDNQQLWKKHEWEMEFKSFLVVALKEAFKQWMKLKSVINKSKI